MQRQSTLHIGRKNILAGMDSYPLGGFVTNFQTQSTLHLSCDVEILVFLRCHTSNGTKFQAIARVTRLRPDYLGLILLDIPSAGHSSTHGAVSILFLDLYLDLGIGNGHGFDDAGIVAGTGGTGVNDNAAI